MKYVTITLSMSALLFASEGAEAKKYPSDLFSVTQLHLDEVRRARGLDWYLQSREASAILGSIASYMGVDPFYVTLARAVAPSGHQQGEEAFYTVPVEPGYAYCASRIRINSIFDGANRNPVIDASAMPDSVIIYTWTPVPGLGQGQSSIEADVQVYGVMQRYHSEFVRKGVCKDVTQQVGLLRCEGNPCSGSKHGNPDLAGQETYGDLDEGW